MVKNLLVKNRLSKLSPPLYICEIWAHMNGFQSPKWKFSVFRDFSYCYYHCNTKTRWNASTFKIRIICLGILFHPYITVPKSSLHGWKLRKSDILFPQRLLWLLKVVRVKYKCYSCVCLTDGVIISNTANTVWSKLARPHTLLQYHPHCHSYCCKTSVTAFGLLVRNNQYLALLVWFNLNLIVK